MKLDISALCNREIRCSCGHAHFCPIREVVVQNGALSRLPALAEGYGHILLAADENTWAVCGEKAEALLGGRVRGRLIFRREGRLVPDERAVDELTRALDGETDLVVGIGSGVINDICKFVTC